MRSLRSERNKAKSKSQIMTKGGVYDYAIEPNDMLTLAKIIHPISIKQLPLFLNLLLTKKELVDITRRITIAKMLMNDKTYEEISKDIHTSRNTISFVQSSLADYDGFLEQALSSANPTNNHKDWPLSMAEKRIFNRIKKGK